MATRFLFAALGALVFLGVLAGSWVPFDFRSAELASVWQEFRSQSITARTGRPDLVANVLVGLPMSFFWMGALLGGDNQGRGRTPNPLGAITGIFFVSAAVSLAAEIGQGWFGNRVPSQRDFIAQIAGAMIGCGLWIVLGPLVFRHTDVLLTGRGFANKLRACAILSAVGVLVWAILPADLMLSPSEYAAKWRSGGIELVPFVSQKEAGFGFVYQALVSALLGIPLGAGFASLIPSWSRSRDWALELLAALGLGLVPELMQVAIASRVASATDALFGAVGAWGGMMIVRKVTREIDLKAADASSSRPWYSRPAPWILLSGLAMFAIAVASLYPFEFVFQTELVKQRLEQLLDEPFSDYRGSNLRILFIQGRLAVVSFLLGALLGISVVLFQGLTARYAAALVSLAVVWGFAVAIELAQLLEQSHTGGAIGMVLRGVGSTMGLCVGAIVVYGLNARRSE